MCQNVISSIIWELQELPQIECHSPRTIAWINFLSNAHAGSNVVHHRQFSAKRIATVVSSNGLCSYRESSISIQQSSSTVLVNIFLSYVVPVIHSLMSELNTRPIEKLPVIFLVLPKSVLCMLLK